jgi:hypothetical protein
MKIKSQSSLQKFVRDSSSKRVLVLCHIPPGPPLRETELLSITWRNTVRQRHVFIWEKLVMLYTQYHKGQQQSGAYKDNIRFLPKAIGDLLLQYNTYVLPLRQLFLRRQKPGAFISPYLWAKLDGSVWPDGTISACLTKACTRAKVPRLHTLNWRQFAASISKKKFSAKEQTNFDLEDNVGEDIEDELDLAALAEQSNHSYHTFNHGYADTTTLTMNTLLHQNYCASESWQTLGVMIGTAMSDATTTILILPMVVLRADMLRRFHAVGIRYLVWSVDCKQATSLEVYFSVNLPCCILKDIPHTTSF